MRSLTRAGLAGAAVMTLALAGSGGPGHASERSGLPVEQLAVDTAHGVRRFKVEIADTDAERERGLMFRKHLAADHGMFFEFDASEMQAFWMKNTFIPLDIIYIGADGRIVSIARDAKPFDETPLYSTGPAIAVLEIKGGLAKKLDIRPGDKVEHPFFHKR